MKKLYIDFDGVIMSTNDGINNLLYENNIDINSYNERIAFLKNVEWDLLLKKSTEISNAFNNLEILRNSNLFELAILTHVCSDKEAEEKRKLIFEKIGDIEVISVPRHHEKCDFVDPTNAILVDDYTKNLELWEKNGGISIKFTNKKYSKFKSTYNLLELLDFI